MVCLLQNLLLPVYSCQRDLLFFKLKTHIRPCRLDGMLHSTGRLYPPTRYEHNLGGIHPYTFQNTPTDMDTFSQWGSAPKLPQEASFLSEVQQGWQSKNGQNKCENFRSSQMPQREENTVVSQLQSKNLTRTTTLKLRGTLQALCYLHYRCMAEEPEGGPSSQRVTLH